MASKKKSKDDFWDILEALSQAICLVTVATECLGHKAIAGDEYTTLKVGIKQLLDCHERLDRSKEEDGQRKEE